MRKYLQVFKTGWNEMLIYRFDVISSAVFSITRLLLAFLLWKAIFRVKPTIDGYSFSMMMTYYILVTFLARLDKSEEAANQFALEIRNGGFAKYITRPVNVLYYFLSITFSRTTYILFINVIGLFVWITLFRNYFIGSPPIFISIWATVIFLMGLVFLALFNFFLTILTFWFLDVSSFFLFKSNLIEFFTGTLIPLNLLPDGVVSVFKILPFYYVFYFPVSLYLNPKTGEIFTAVLVLGIWVFIFLIGNIFLYKKAKKSFDGVGI